MQSVHTYLISRLGFASERWQRLFPDSGWVFMFLFRSGVLPLVITWTPCCSAAVAKVMSIRLHDIRR